MAACKLTRLVLLLATIRSIAICVQTDQNQNQDASSYNYSAHDVGVEMQGMYVWLQRMYTAITHGDAPYFKFITKQLSNETYAPLLEDPNAVQAIENNFVHLLNTMRTVHELATKVHATPMQINQMNDALLMSLKTMVRFLKRSTLNTLMADHGPANSAYHTASFVSQLLCEAISLSLQFRLIDALKYLLTASTMNNSELYHCLHSYHNIANQTLFHLATKSRSSGFARLFFHLPASLPVMKHLHINNKNVLSLVDIRNPIINQQMIKKRVSDVEVLLLLKAAFRVQMANEWYLRRDLHRKSAFDLWQVRAPYYLRFVYYHAVISKLFSSHHRHFEFEDRLCISMAYVAEYWPIVQWFPIPIHDEHITQRHNVQLLQVSQQSAFDDAFPVQWYQQQPMIFRQGMAEKWNLSALTLDELSRVFQNETFVTSDIPYQELYDDYGDEASEQQIRVENTVNFDDYIATHFHGQQKLDLDVLCGKQKRKRKSKQNENELLDISYIFDAHVYWRNQRLMERFNVSQLIPAHIEESMQSMLHEYKDKYDVNETLTPLDSHTWIHNIIMLKQVSIGGIGSGAQPHFHGPVLNVLLMGEKQWIIVPPHKAFQTKQTALDFFCHHHSLSAEKKANLTYLTFTQNAGDIVFIPQEWTHAVLNVQPSIGVAVELFV